MLQRAHDQLAALREHALAVVGGLGADGGLQLALHLVDALGVVGDLLCDRLGASESRRGTADQALRRVDGTGDKLAALVVSRELVRHLALINLKAHGRLGPLLGGTDGVHVRGLARSGLAAVADAHGQVDADVVVVREQREPQVAGEVSHTGENHLVALGDTLEGAGAGDVALLVGAGHAGDLVVHLSRHVSARRKRLGRADGRAQAALAAVIANQDGLLVNRDCRGGADVDAAGADLGVVGGGAQAAVGVGKRLLLVVSGVEHLALLGVKGLHHALEGVGQSLPVTLYVNQIVKKITLLGHGHSLSLSQ